MECADSICPQRRLNMSDQSSQEPTMEEILASIRRIISEDDAPATDEGAEEEEVAAPVVGEVPLPILEAEPAEAPAEALAPAPEAEPEPEDEVLELTDRVESLGDLDVYTPASPPQAAVEPVVKAPALEPQYVPLPPLSVGEGLVSDPAANAAAAAFGHLSASMLMPKEGRTLEDVVRELLRPMLKQWLDEHLPNIVQESVRSEVERISRGGRVG